MFFLHQRQGTDELFVGVNVDTDFQSELRDSFLIRLGSAGITVQTRVWLQFFIAYMCDEAERVTKFRELVRSARSVEKIEAFVLEAMILQQVVSEAPTQAS